MTDIQICILEILKDIIQTLEDMDMGYYMQGGTMLGAVRHKGFIPWDDDIDIGVLRKDYEKFVASVSKKLPEHLELRTYEDSSEHHYYFARIVDTRYTVKRGGSLETMYENAWIDIFPLDGMPNGFMMRNVHKARLLFWRLKYHLSCFEKVNIKRPGRPLVERIIIRVGLIINLKNKSNYKRYLNRIDTLLKKYPVEKSDWIINFMGQTSYRFNELFKKDVYGKPTLYQFEDIQLLGPEKYDRYLSSLYGNYMRLPKEKDRNVHVSELIKKEE